MSDCEKAVAPSPAAPVTEIVPAEKVVKVSSPVVSPSKSAGMSVLSESLVCNAKRETVCNQLFSFEQKRKRFFFVYTNMVYAFNYHHRVANF